MVKIVDTIDLNKLYKDLVHPAAGGLCLFVGTVRDNTESKEVTDLFFETYDEMAILEMEKIRQEAIEKWKLEKVIMVHAIGKKSVGEPVVVVGVSSAHRKEAFPACQFLIDELKKTVPIWKKEYFTDNSHWVSPTP
ncbi:MAG: molybdenum cofactor biosynthesis protein MoaE [Cytophagales bacterium]|nr:molybdenum cofactor biosynthesis protein MoaE [Cytophagales bacterium]